MDSRLFMEIGINNDGELEVIDQTPYERWINDGEFDPGHQVLERVILNNGDETPTVIAFSNLTGTTPEELRHSTIYDVPGNGLYHYQKLVIPTYTHSQSHENEHLYYRNGIVYYIDEDAGTSQSWSSLAEDFDEIYSVVTGEKPDNCFHFDDDSFSMYDLLECYVLTERERIQNYLKNNCAGNCDRTSDLDERADILLAAVTVIRHLMEIGDFFEAQRILNGLDTCGHLCKNVQNKLKGCGCGRT